MEEVSSPSRVKIDSASCKDVVASTNNSKETNQTLLYTMMKPKSTFPMNSIIYFQKRRKNHKIIEEEEARIITIMNRLITSMRHQKF